MAYNGFAIDTYLDAEAVNQELDALIQKPVYTIRREKLKDYVQNYFEQKCSQSKAMIAQAKKVIPGGVQHNLAFNYPFPIVITKAEGAKLYDLDGNWYYDLLQAGGPTILGSNMPAVREPVSPCCSMAATASAAVAPSGSSNRWPSGRRGSSMLSTISSICMGILLCMETGYS